MPPIPLLPQTDVSKFERTADLLKFRDQLRNSDLKARFQCLFCYLPEQEYCTYDCNKYSHDHPELFRRASNILARDVDRVEEEHFIVVLRTLFCSTHDLTKGVSWLQVYKKHFEALWKGASQEVKCTVWEAIRESGRGIYPPSTPQRPHRLRNAHISSAPAGVPQVNLEAPQDVTLSPPNPDSDTPSRPRTAQAQLSHSAELSTESHIYPRSSSSSPPPARLILKPRPVKFRAERAVESSPEIPKTDPFFFNTSDATESDSFQQPQRDNAAHIKADLLWKQMHRDIVELKITAPWYQQKQDLDQSKFESIFDKLGKRANDSTSHDVEAEKDNEQLSIPLPQAEKCPEESVTRIAANNLEHQDQPLTFAIREKLPVAQEYEEKETAPGSPRSPNDDRLKQCTNLPKPQNEIIKADTALRSENFTPAKGESSSVQQNKAAALLPKKTAPKPCTYDIRQPGTIATTIRRLLQKDIIDERTGDIYVLEAPAFFSSYPPARSRNEQWVKIGISSDVAKRINSLKVKCGITDLKEYYTSDSGVMRMDLLRRIEQVCHAELNNFRRRLDCKNEGVGGGKCNTVHEEWFAVDKSVAKRTVKRWRKFLEYGPYRKDGVLNDFWRDRMAAGKYCTVAESEGALDHELAHKRFDAWLDESIREVEGGRSIAS